MKIIRIIISILITLIIIFLFFLNSFEEIVFDIEHYKEEYTKNNIYEKTGLDSGTLINVTYDIMDYLKGEKEEFIIYDEKGEELFGDREKMHMEDVQILFLRAYAIRRCLIALFIILTILSIFLFKKECKCILKTIFYICTIMLIVLSLIVLLISRDFNRYFNIFHIIFFNNDLWLLNPNRDLLINIVPEEFFYNTAYKILKLFIKKVSILIFMSIFFVVFSKKVLTFRKT